jgi:hypothetical protein
MFGRPAAKGRFPCPPRVPPGRIRVGPGPTRMRLPPLMGRTNESGGSVSRSLQTHSFSTAASRPFDLNGPSTNARTLGMCYTSSRITALNIEFVAKPNEAHKIHAALPAAINGALGEVAGFAGCFVMIANHEARLVTVVTLWSGEDRMQRCSENERWVRALLAPYLDRCLRVQTLATFAPAATQSSKQIEPSCSEGVYETGLRDEQELCVA